MSFPLRVFPSLCRLKLESWGNRAAISKWVIIGGLIWSSWTIKGALVAAGSVVMVHTRLVSVALDKDWHYWDSNSAIRSGRTGLGGSHQSRSVRERKRWKADWVTAHVRPAPGTSRTLKRKPRTHHSGWGAEIRENKLICSYFYKIFLAPGWLFLE